jgi:pimeloyl-ACP methyl ester carboxylesterase
MLVRGVELNVRERGADSSEALLWGHGLMGSMAQEDAAGMLPWEGLDDAFRVVRWDARGHGRSDSTHDPEDYRWTELAADLWALADQLGIERAVVGGVSMGAATALHAAVAEPSRMRGLVLMAPPTAWGSRARQARFYRGMARVVGAIGLGPISRLGDLAARAVSNEGLAAIQRTVTQNMRRADARSVQLTLRGAALSDLPDLDRVATLDAPTLILAWKQDPSHPLSTSEALVERMPNASLHVAEDIDDIRSWSARLRAFITDL